MPENPYASPQGPNRRPIRRREPPQGPRDGPQLAFWSICAVIGWTWIAIDVATSGPRLSQLLSLIPTTAVTLALAVRLFKGSPLPPV